MSKTMRRRLAIFALIALAGILVCIPAFAAPTGSAATAAAKSGSAASAAAGNAYTPTQRSQEVEDLLAKYNNSFLLTGLYSMIDITFGNKSVMSGIVGFLQNFKIPDGFYSSFSVITDAVKLIGVCLLLMYFVFDFIVDKMAPGRELTIEAIVLSFTKLFICVCVIIYAQKLMITIYDLGEAAYSELSGQLSANADVSADVDSIFMSFAGQWDKNYEAEKAAATGVEKFLSFFTAKLEYIYMPAIGVMIELLLPFIGAVAQLGAVFLTLTTRGVKIAFYTVMAPLGLSDIYNGGTHSRAADYIKSFFGLCLQSLFIIVIIVIFQRLKTGMIHINGATSLNFITIVELSAMSFSQVTLLLGAEKLASRVFGA